MQYQIHFIVFLHIKISKRSRSLKNHETWSFLDGLQFSSELLILCTDNECLLFLTTNRGNVANNNKMSTNVRNFTTTVVTALVDLLLWLATLPRDVGRKLTFFSVCVLKLLYRRVPVNSIRFVIHSKSLKIIIDNS